MLNVLFFFAAGYFAGWHARRKLYPSKPQRYLHSASCTCKFCGKL